jgi:hypothetical protein
LLGRSNKAHVFRVLAETPDDVPRLGPEIDRLFGREEIETHTFTMVTLQGFQVFLEPLLLPLPNGFYLPG